ncbi:hypothetical protein DLM_2723 [Aquitalea magnusonii]|uniref:Uncharacterized protein n=1 Tax=Aquitalea magnusonii TaxID=332411 RepID=A0A3G9GG27_9NEIS|nr:hypothetical protein DLM_2723 [Aquitalea magnusonii]
MAIHGVDSAVDKTPAGGRQCKVTGTCRWRGGGSQRKVPDRASITQQMG